MRVVSIAVFLFFFFFFSIFVNAAAGLYKLTHPGKDAEFVFRWITWGFRRVKDLSGMELEVKGKERIPKEGGILYVGNHQSAFDVVLAYGLMERPGGCVAKKEFLKYPIISPLMRYGNCLFLDRSDLRKGMEMISDATALLQRGVSVVIYPEGTRNNDPDHLLEFHKGSFKMAQRSGCHIVPVTINGTRDVFEAHLPWIFKKKVIMEYGEPFTFRDLDKEDQKNIHLYVKKIIEETYRKNAKRLTDKGA